MLSGKRAAICIDTSDSVKGKMFVVCVISVTNGMENVCGCGYTYI